MVKAVVGANWGDEGRVRSQTCSPERRISSFVFRVVRMQAIQL